MSGFPAAFAWQASATQAECKHRICGKRLGCRASLIHAFALSAYLGGVVVEDAAEASLFTYPATQRCLCKFFGRQTLAGDAFLPAGSGAFEGLPARMQDQLL